MSNPIISYEFISKAMPDDDPLRLVSFTGTEGVSQLFRFTLELKSRGADVDVDGLLRQPAALKMTVGDHTRQINGELLQFDVIGQSGPFTIYQAVLVPRLHKLSLYRSNEVHVDETLPEIIESVLGYCGLTSLDYDLRLDGHYRRLPLCCQFDESYLDFLSRLMERVGIYYFFEHDDKIDRLVLCDSLQGQDALTAPDIRFSAPSGMQVTDFPDGVHGLVCRQKRMPARVVYKDYNDENPSVNIQGHADVDPDGLGEVYDYGSHVGSPGEARRLAEVAAQQILTEKRRYYGDSTVSRLQPGFTVMLSGHFRAAMNQPYQILAIDHEGSAPSLQTGESGQNGAYRNSFTALETDVQFRPARDTARPRFYGTMNAFIDSETDGEYAQVDSTGRYKVVFPFDRVTRKEAKASCWIRMAQPYAGEGEGMHFPLRKNAEVLLTFIGGDPDRPVISGAVPNHSKPSVITDQNQTKNIIQTSKGNKIEIEDREDCKRIKLFSPHKNTYMHLGAPDHAGDGWVVMTEGLERKEILGGQHITIRSVVSGAASGASTSHKIEAKPLIALTSDATRGIAVVGLESTNKGVWQYRKRTATTWLMFSAMSESNAVVLDGRYEVRFERVLGAEGSVTLTYHTWEYSDAGTGGRLDVTAIPIFDTQQTASVSLSQSDIDPPADPQPLVISDDSLPFAVVAADGTGSWQYRPPDGAWTDLPSSISPTSAVFMEAGTALQLLPGGGSPGTFNLDYRVGLEDLPGSTRLDVSTYASFFGDETTETIEVEADLIDESTMFGFRKQANDRVDEDTNGASDGDEFERTDELSGNFQISRVKAPRYSWHEGASFHYQTGPSLNVKHSDNGPKTASGGAPSIAKTYAELKTALLDDLYGNVAGYKPAGAKVYGLDSSYAPVAKAWNNVIRDAHVSLVQHDTITGQKGNIYDFGGYWNYNLGNSYEENHIQQGSTVTLNQVAADSYDILESGGPELGQLKAKIGDETLSTHQFEYVLDSVSALDPGTFWTSKTYDGDSYDYRVNGKAIEVNENVSTLTINKGGRHVELSFSGSGQKTSWSKSGEGESFEKTWHLKNGNLLSDSSKLTTANGYNWTETTYSPLVSGKKDSVERGSISAGGLNVYSESFTAKSSASFEFGAAVSFSFSANTSFALNVSLAATTSISVTGSLSFSYSASAGITLEGEMSAGPTIKFGMKPMELDLRADAVLLDVNSTLGTMTIKTVGAQFEASLLPIAIENKALVSEMKAMGFKITA